MERGTVEWNINSGTVELSVDDPVPLIPTYCACAVHSVQRCIGTKEGMYYQTIINLCPYYDALL